MISRNPAHQIRKRSEFMRHVKSHLRQKGVSEDEAQMALWYYCDKCGKKFHAEYYLEKHIREVHEGAFTPSTWKVHRGAVTWIPRLGWNFDKVAAGS